MMSEPAKTPDQLIAYLNAIGVGEIDVIRTKLAEARLGCERLEQADLVDKLQDADRALSRADMKTYRKRLETVISRLGHLR